MNPSKTAQLVWTSFQGYVSVARVKGFLIPSSGSLPVWFSTGSDWFLAWNQTFCAKSFGWIHDCPCNGVYRRGGSPRLSTWDPPALKLGKVSVAGSACARFLDELLPPPPPPPGPPPT